MLATGRQTERHVQTLRMNPTPQTLEHRPSVQAPPQSEPGGGLQSPPVPDPPGREARTRRVNRGQLIAVLAACLLAAVLAMGLYVNHGIKSRRLEPGGSMSPPCLTPACLRAAARLTVSPDPFARPCDYFLSSCGSPRPTADGAGRRRGQGVPEHPQNQRQDWALRGGKNPDRKTLLLKVLREILESNDGPGSSAIQKTRAFYQSCLDSRTVETAGAEPFLRLLRKLGGWPVSGPWNRTDFNGTLALLMRDFATFPFFNVFVGRDANSSNTGRKYIQIDQPDLLIPIKWNSKTQKSQANAQVLQSFLALCQRVMQLLGVSPNTSSTHVWMFVSLSSQLAVAAAPLTHRLSHGQLYRRVTVRQLQTQAPAIDWLRCLRAAVHPSPVAEDDAVLLHNEPYVLEMSRIVNKWLASPDLSSSGPLHTFMVFSLLHTLTPALDSRFSQAFNNLLAVLGDPVEEGTPRWKRCLLETERGFGPVLAHLLRRRTALAEAKEIAENILLSLKSTLGGLKWKEEKFFRAAEEKIRPLTPRLCSSHRLSRPADLDSLFSEVSVRKSFFSNYVLLLSLVQRRRGKLLRAEEEGEEKEAHVLTVAPSLQGAELVVPLGIFVPPLFHPSFPRAVNYGAVGFFLAKDALRLLLPDISSQSSAVQEVSECVWNRYLSVTGRGGGGDGDLTAAQRHEVWLRFLALQVTLQAFQQSLDHQPVDSSLSGFSHTHLLLRSFSQVDCDTDPDGNLMPLETSFLITAVCTEPGRCPSRLRCPNGERRALEPAC